MSTRCFLNRESFVVNTIDQELKFDSNNMNKIVNYVESKPLESRLFVKYCEEMGYQHVNIILYTEIRCTGFLKTAHFQV
jgi:hypothetical protein